MEIKTNRTAKGDVIESTELNAYLLRFWSLFESCYHSNYIIAGLKTWTEDGSKDLDKLFVQVGIPLTEARQKFQFMSTKHKENMVQKFLQVVSNKDLKYNLPEISVRTFVKVGILFTKQIDNNL